MIEYFGALASFLFIAATAAQTIKCIKQGHAKGISHALIWVLSVGFTCMIIYVIKTIGFDWILLSSYVLQYLLWLIIAKYRYFPKKQRSNENQIQNTIFLQKQYRF